MCWLKQTLGGGSGRELGGLFTLAPGAFSKAWHTTHGSKHCISFVNSYFLDFSFPQHEEEEGWVTAQSLSVLHRSWRRADHDERGTLVRSGSLSHFSAPTSSSSQDCHPLVVLAALGEVMEQQGTLP